MEERRGLWQGDPMSPLLFVIMMEYLNRCLKRLKNNPNFNFHSKCEKLNITNLCFADDLLLFTRGDMKSVRLVMTAYNVFSLSTGLKFNPAKCCTFFGGVDQTVRNDIKNLTGFAEGNLPFRYLRIPMSSKRLSAQAYDSLIDKIMGKINHWSSRLLSYAGRLLLVKSVTFALTNYWMQCLPIPKCVIHKINVVCLVFLWTGKTGNNRKSPVAWSTISKPKKNGGLNMIDLDIWNTVTLLKLLWNLSGKVVNLWERWINTSYVKNQNIMDIGITTNASWIVKVILNQRDCVRGRSWWGDMLHHNIFKMSKIYKEFLRDVPQVPWKSLFYGNLARPRAKINLWLSCNERLATKSRLYRFGMVDSPKCCFSSKEETQSRLLFDCVESKGIWMKVLDGYKSKTYLVDGLKK